jgi:HD-like signal output (HDOD) protein
MVHDIGRVVLIMRKKKEFAAYIERLSSGEADSRELEKAMFGVDHAQVGAYLIKTWGLPNILVESVLKHHTLAPVDVSAVDARVLTFVANFLAHEFSRGKTHRLHAETANPAVLRHLGSEAKLAQWRGLCKRCMGE